MSDKSASSAVAPYVALRPKEISGSRVLFYLVTFLQGLSKVKQLAKRRKIKLTLLLQVKVK